ncbi:hypothetical protein RB195_023170 [Necator americanus]|uniref:Zeta toxin domain-containing protein n=1 Tax=Necator americanus TaxID=51031 RepID=A0ABR1EI38_NECAM
MTGLIYNRPKEPLIFLETAIAQIRTNPKEELTWDMFIDRGKVDILSELEVSPKISSGGNEERSNSVIRTHPNDVRKSVINTAERSKKFKHKEKEKEENQVSLRNIEDTQVPTPEMGRAQRSPSVMKAAEVAHIPHVPVILFIGGPGGGKTRHAARVASALADQGLIHICMPDMIRSALAKYKDQYSEWKTAHEHYLRAIAKLLPINGEPDLCKDVNVKSSSSIFEL